MSPLRPNLTPENIFSILVPGLYDTSSRGRQKFRRLDHGDEGVDRVWCVGDDNNPVV